MLTARNKLYFILSIACLAGYIWLFYSVIETQAGRSGTTDVCLIKHITGVPCPSCGSTRSVLTLLDGNLLGSLSINPFGLIIALIMITLPPWIIFDFVTGRRSLSLFYSHAEAFLRNRIVAIPLVLLVLINWVWNISKGL